MTKIDRLTTLMTHFSLNVNPAPVSESTLVITAVDDANNTATCSMEIYVIGESLCWGQTGE